MLILKRLNLKFFCNTHKIEIENTDEIPFNKYIFTIYILILKSVRSSSVVSITFYLQLKFLLT